VRAEHAPHVAAQIRAAVPSGASVAEDVAAIIAEVRARGDDAVREYEARFGEVRELFKVGAEELDAALAALGDDAHRDGAMEWEYLLLTARRATS
jgi:histidinol dehydrogenase